MNEFDDGGEINVRGPFVPKRMGAQQQGDGAQSLSARADDVMAYLLDEGDIRAQFTLNMAVNCSHVLPDEGIDGGQQILRRFGASRRLV